MARPTRPERFDVLGPNGIPTGRTRRRDLVHRHGDWHRAFHCWIVIEVGEASPSVLLQRRADDKDTYPGRIDVSVGGHYRTGEGLADVIREMPEEVGQGAPLADLRPLGTRIAVCDMEAGIRDREVQDVYLWRTPLPFDSFRPNPEEVKALELVTVEAFLELVTRQRTTVASRQRLPDGTGGVGVVAMADLVPTLDDYFRRAAVAIDLAVKGYPFPTV